MATFYARFRLEGINSEQYAKVNANGLIEARKIIEARYGKVKMWHNGPQRTNKPPRWYKG